MIEINKDYNKTLMIIYMATVLAKESYTIEEIAEVFESDTHEWFKHNQEPLSTNLHAFLSIRFKMAQNISEDMDYVTRFKNENNKWEYRINIKDTQIQAKCIEVVSKMLEKLDLSYELDQDNQVIERNYLNDEGLYISAPKIFALCEWLEAATGSLLESALTFEQAIQLKVVKY